MSEAIVNSNYKKDLSEKHKNAATDHEVRTESEPRTEEPSTERISKGNQDEEDENTENRSEPWNIKEFQSDES